MNIPILKVFLSAFLISLIGNYLLIKSNWGLDLTPEEKPHAIYAHPVPRMGGLAIVIAIAVLSLFFSRELLLILSTGLAIFTFAFLEDRFHFDLPYSYKISFLAISTLFLLYFTKELVYDLGFIVLKPQNPLETSLAFLIAFVGLVGFASAVNFIDGLNGYSMGAMAISLSFFSIVFYHEHVHNLFLMTVILLGAIAGFLVFNFPYGKIFLGDMGAHLMGFIIGYLSIALANHTSLSSWYPLAVFSIPIIETLYTIFRRIKRKKLYGIPFSESEKDHLHHLVLNYVQLKFDYLRKDTFLNSLSSIFILVFYFLINLLAFMLRKNDFLLITLFGLIVIVYIYVYNLLKVKVSGHK